MNDMLKWAIAVMVPAVVAVFWGFQYRGNHPLAPLSGLFGATDPTYSFAGWCIGLGIVAFLVGLGLLIGGLVRQPAPPPTTPQ